jgi:poly-gamma-glutamate synthesis protein (capsule biosynthesis protein)
MAYSFIDDFIHNSAYNKVKSERKILEDIKKIRDSVDLVIVSLHWGYEYTPFPSPEQVEIGRRLIDYGTDIIIFDDTYIKSTRKSMIAKIRVDMTTKDIKIDFIPVICDPKDFYPKIVDGSDKNDILNIISTVRAKLENKSLVEYRSEMGDYPALASKYKRTAKRDMKKQFIKNLYRLPPTLSLSIVKDYLQKRFR